MISRIWFQTKNNVENIISLEKIKFYFKKINFILNFDLRISKCNLPSLF